MPSSLSLIHLRPPTFYGERGGFTLVELLIVIVILSVLAALVVPGVLNQVEKGRTAEAITTLGRMKTAEENYYALNGGVYYPNTPGVGVIDPMIVTTWTALGLQEPPLARASFKYSITTTTMGTGTFLLTATRVAPGNTTYNGKTITLDNTATWGGDHPDRPVSSAGTGS